MTDLSALSNRALQKHATANLSDTALLLEIYKILHNRNDKPSKTRAINAFARHIATHPDYLALQPPAQQIQQPVPGWWTPLKRGIALLSILASAIIIGIMQGVGRDLWQNYGAIIRNFITGN